MHYVYWIHSPEETDIWTQGYVGYTGQIKDRQRKHRAILEGRSFTVICAGTIHYCRELEYKLRPGPNIGLNEAQGGGGGNMAGRKHREESKKKIGKANKRLEQWKYMAEAIRMPKSEEHKRKIGDAQRGEKNHQWGKPSPRRGVTLDAETKRKCGVKPAGWVPWNKNKKMGLLYKRWDKKRTPVD